MNRRTAAEKGREMGVVRQGTPPSHALGAHGRGEGGWAWRYGQGAPASPRPTPRTCHKGLRPVAFRA